MKRTFFALSILGAAAAIVGFGAVDALLWIAVFPHSVTWQLVSAIGTVFALPLAVVVMLDLRDVWRGRFFQ